MNLRRLDAFHRARPDLQQKTLAGGLITLIAAAAAGLLCAGQIAAYWSGASHHALRLSRSLSVPLLPVEYKGGAQEGAHRSQQSHGSPLLQRVLAEAAKINLHVHVTFPHLQCDQLDVLHDGASLARGELEKALGRHTLRRRPPTPAERRAAGAPAGGSGGCTVEGTLRPYVVAGVLQVTISPKAWAEATSAVARLPATDTQRLGQALERYNVSHYIHAIEFGRTYHGSAAKPLMNRAHVIQNDYGGIAVESINVKLVPTVSRGLFLAETTYQTSVVEHTIQPQTLVAHGVPNLPGLVLSYDFTPLTVDLDAHREGFLVFLSSLISILAGVFVTVSLVTGCLVQSAAAVAKKID